MSNLYHSDCGTPVQRENVVVPPDVKARLEELRAVIESESISYGEIAELQDLADYIEDGDVQLLEWAGVPEFSPRPGTYFCSECDHEVRPDALYSDRYQRFGPSIIDIDSDDSRTAWIGVVLPDSLDQASRLERVQHLLDALNHWEAGKVAR